MVEFALALPVLIMLLVGLIEYGRYAYFAIEVGNAAHAGAEYGAQSSTTAQDTAGMQNAAIADGQNTIFPLTSTAVTANYVCSCWNGTTEATPTGALCGQVCTAGRPVTYAQVSVSGTISPLLNYSLLGLPSSWTVNRTATIRVLQ